MWIPYGLLDALKAETSRESVEAAQRDREPREFLVGFYVRNPVTQAWEADLLVGQDSCQEGVMIGGQPGFVGYFPGKSGKLEEIIYRATGRAARDTLASCYAHAADVLALWSVQTGRGIDIAGYRIADVKHHARWRCAPFRPSSLDMTLPEIADLGPAHLELAALYREARNATSSRWRLLCALAILEAWLRRAGAFAATDRALAARGERRRERMVSRDMLLRSGALGTHDGLLDQPFAALVRRLRLDRDKLLAGLGEPAQGGLRGGLAAETDLGALASLADLAACQVLVEELELHRSFAIGCSGEAGSGWASA